MPHTYHKNIFSKPSQYIQYNNQDQIPNYICVYFVSSFIHVTCALATQTVRGQRLYYPYTLHTQYAGSSLNAHLSVLQDLW